MTVKLAGGCSPLTFQQSDGVQKIAVFTIGYRVVAQQYQDPHLYMNSWDGAQWVWSDLGTPIMPNAAAALFCRPSAMTFEGPGSGQQLMYAFVPAIDNFHLYVNAWEGAQWQWSDLGAPPFTSELGLGPLNCPLGVINYEDADIQIIRAFVTGLDGQLYMNSWDGAQRVWSNLGVPPTDPSNPFGVFQNQVISGPSAITYLDPSTFVQKIAAFVKVQKSPPFPTEDIELYVNFWDGTQSNWTAIGPYQQAQPGFGEHAPVAISFPSKTGSAQVIRVYYLGEADSQLYVASSIDGVNWSQEQLNMLPTGPDGGVLLVGSDPAVITFTRPGVTTTVPEIREVWAFTTGYSSSLPPSRNHLLLNSWNDFNGLYRWIDLGTNPNATELESPPDAGPPAALTYQDPGSGQQVVFVFTIGHDGHLYMTQWNGAQWQWSDLGTPPF